MKITPKIVNSILQLNVSRSNLNRYIRNHYKLIYARILEQTKFLNKFANDSNNSTYISIFERLYCILNDLTDRPLCQKCHENYVSGFNLYSMSYSKWCCVSCQASDPECISKSKASRKKIYGNENYNGVEKSRKTRADKNNGKWHADDFGDKCKATNVENGHDPNWHNSEKARITIAEKVKDDPDFWIKREAKTKATKVENGHDPNWNNREQYHATVLDKYGVSSYTQSDDWYQKTIATISADPDFYTKRNEKTQITIENDPEFYTRRDEKTRKSNNDKIGCDYYFQSVECREKRAIASYIAGYEVLVNDEKDFPLFTVDELIENRDDIFHEYQFECKKCHSKFSTTLNSCYAQHQHCEKCYPISKSKSEEEIFEFCKSIVDCNIIHKGIGSRQVIHPYELDIYIPSYNFAIEFNGVFWHSENNGTDTNYHLMKTELCQQKNIKLLHIFENEWLFKKDVVKNEIRKNLNIYTSKVDEKDCMIQLIKANVARQFFCKNSIENYVNSCINIALTYKGEIISVMSFCKSRYDNTYEWELTRAANKIDYVVVNGFTRMFDYFIQLVKPHSIVSYSNLRYFNGEIQKYLGFNLINNTAPMKWIARSDVHQLIPYQSISKSYAIQHLKTYDDTKSLIENLYDNRWYVLSDCGRLVFSKLFI